jgi:hypothetical protein
MDDSDVDEVQVRMVGFSNSFILDSFSWTTCLMAPSGPFN